MTPADLHVDPDNHTLPSNDTLPSALIGQRIAEARVARGLNRNQLARTLGTSWAVVNRWEKGRSRPSTDSIQRLAQVLEVTVDRLLGAENSPSSRNDELEKFVRDLAPPGLSPEELRWLEAAPAQSVGLTARDYADLLDLLRRVRRREDASGSYPKVRPNGRAVPPDGPDSK